MQKYLIVGLGNKGEEYKNTRHNIGFEIVDELVKPELFKKMSFGWISEFNYKGNKLYVLKPDTYMNLSGRAVKYWKNKLNIETSNILIINDDLHLDLGVIRLKQKGSHAGHNGLKNIELELNSSQYPRLRFGIGNDYKEGKQIDYVLGKWTEDEKKYITNRIEIAVETIKCFCFSGIIEAMNKYNGV